LRRKGSALAILATAVDVSGAVRDESSW